MKALLLAAGEGTRLRPFTLDRPKAMVEINGEPAVAYSLRWLRREGISEVVINLYHHGEVLERFVDDGSAFGLRVQYSHERELLGTAGALRPVAQFFTADSAFLVLYGDVLTNLRLAPVLALHERSGADATIVLTKVEDPTSAGVVAYDEAGRITRLVEKPRAEDVFSDWVNGGVYVCGARVVDYVASAGAQDFAHHLFPAMLRDGRMLMAYPSNAWSIDYGVPERLTLAEEAIRHGVYV